MASFYSCTPPQLTYAGSLAPSANSQYADTASLMVMPEEHLAMFGAAIANAAYQRAMVDVITALSVMLSSAMSENGDTQSQMSAGPMLALSLAESAAPTAAESVLAPSVVESGQPKDLLPEQQQRTGIERIEGAQLNNDDFEEEAFDAAELEELKKQAEAIAVSRIQHGYGSRRPRSLILHIPQGPQTAPEVPRGS